MYCLFWLGVEFVIFELRIFFFVVRFGCLVSLVKFFSCGVLFVYGVFVFDVDEVIVCVIFIDIIVCVVFVGENDC